MVYIDIKNGPREDQLAPSPSFVGCDGSRGDMSGGGGALTPSDALVNFE